MNNYRIQLGILSITLFFLLLGKVSAGELSAQLAWSKRLVLSTTVTGGVDKVLVTPGQKLKKGDLLLTLDEREFKAAKDQAAARLLAARTTHDEAKREVARSQELFDRTMISEHDLQLVKNSEAQARAAYLHARAKLQETEIALERSRVQAPYDCIVLNVPAQKGQTVLSNLNPEPLAVIAEAGHMVARAWLTSAEVDKYLTQKASEVRIANRKFAVVSQQLMPEANEKGQYTLDVIFTSIDATLHAGQVGSIIFP